MLWETELAKQEIETFMGSLEWFTDRKEAD